MTQLQPGDKKVTIIPNQPHSDNSWKRSVYVLGAAAGTLFGLLSAYLYARATEESTERSGGKPQPVPTRHLISLALAALGLMRQISEIGKEPKK